MAAPTYSQRYYEIAIERIEASITNGTAAQDQVDRLEGYRRELRWWVTGKRDVVTPTNKTRRAIGSADIIHSVEQTAAFAYACTSEQDHRLFSSPEGRHLHTMTRFGRQNVSVRRFAYSLLHPEDPFTEQDDITVTCQHTGDNATGNGVCVTHLKKVPAYGSHAVRSLALPGSGDPRRPVVPYSQPGAAASCS